MTKYPIQFKKGKLVRYLKPTKHIEKYSEYSYDIRDGNTLSDLIKWVEERGGNYQDSYFDSYCGYDDDANFVFKIRINFTEDEIQSKEKEYEKLLKDWEEWRILSKEAKKTDDAKAKLARAKSLKTQEMNLLARLEKIRIQQNTI